MMSEAYYEMKGRVEQVKQKWAEILRNAGVSQKTIDEFKWVEDALDDGNGVSFANSPLAHLFVQGAQELGKSCVNLLVYPVSDYWMNLLIYNALKVLQDTMKEIEQNEDISKPDIIKTDVALFYGLTLYDFTKLCTIDLEETGQDVSFQ